MEERNLRKICIGVVVSNKMDKIISVFVQCRLQYFIYGKFVKKSCKFVAYDENNDCNIGDKVCIMEICLFSKCKCWWFVEIIECVK